MCGTIMSIHVCVYIYIYIWMYVCGSQCVFVDGWLKKEFYLQHLWMASGCLEKFLCVNCLWVVFVQKWTKSCAHVNLCKPA